MGFSPQSSAIRVSTSLFITQITRWARGICGGSSNRKSLAWASTSVQTGSFEDHERAFGVVFSTHVSLFVERIRTQAAQRVCRQKLMADRQGFAQHFVFPCSSHGRPK